MGGYAADAWEHQHPTAGRLGSNYSAYQPLNNATAPYGSSAGSSAGAYGAGGSGARSRGATPTSQFRQKPPTPPPAARDRSASPSQNAVSPIFGRKPQVVLDSERKYQERLDREAARAKAANGEPDYQRPRKAGKATGAGPRGPAGPRQPFDSELRQRFRQQQDLDEEDEPGRYGSYARQQPQPGPASPPGSNYATKSILKRSGSGSQDSNYAYNNSSSTTTNTSGSGAGRDYQHYYGPSSADSMGSSAHSHFSAPEIYASPYRYTSSAGERTPLAEVGLVQLRSVKSVLGQMIAVSLFSFQKCRHNSRAD